MDWDLTSYFPEFNGSDYNTFKTQLIQDLKDLDQNLTELGAITPDNLSDASEWICDYEQARAKLGHIASYLSCLNSADSANEAYQKDEAWFSEFAADFSKVDARLNSVIGRMDADTFAALLKEASLANAAFALEQKRYKSQFQMSDDDEALASEMNIHGLNAWSRLYDTLAGQTKFEYTDETGEKQTVPMAQRVSLTTGPNRAVRESAFKGSNKAWDQHAATCNAALNSLAGTRLGLDKRRGVNHFLDNACFQSKISKESLDAMFQAIDDNIDVPRNILKFRAGKMGLDKISMWDFGAPLDLPNSEPINWESGTTLIQSAFDNAYPALGDFHKEVLLKNWTDYQPRDNKRPGGFCTGSHLTGESRIYMTFKDTMSAVTTMAHEVGHAWHSRVMKDQRPLASSYPMTLAESASTFAELLLADGIISSPDYSDAQKLVLLDANLSHAQSFLLDIPVRYKWEKRFYEERQEGIVSVSRMKEIMAEEQINQLGPILDPDGIDPYFWCSKLHFYIDSVMFYNFPYTVGYLLSCSLFGLFKKEGASFLPKYEDYLNKSGSMSCEQVVKESLGEDITDPAFWARAIQSLNEPFEQMKKLLQ